MIEWTLIYVTTKSILCFISINTKNSKNQNQKFKLYLGKFCAIFFIVGNASVRLIAFLVN